MPIKKETLELVEKLLKIKTGSLVAAQADTAEVDVPIDDKLSVLSEEELTTVKGNSYKDGKKAGVEMEVDSIKKELNLDFTGKTVKGLADAVAKKAVDDAKIEPDKKVTELTQKLATVQQTATDLQTKLAEKEGELTSVKTLGTLTKDIPANLSLPANKVLLLMKEDGYEYKTEDGKIVWYKDGKALTDKLGNNMPTKDVTTEYATANKLLTEAAPKGGRGKGDESGPAGVFTKLSEIKAKYTAEGKSMLGDEFRQAVAEASKVDGFDMNA